MKIIHKLKRQMKENELKISIKNELEYRQKFQSGESFGELSLTQYKPRAGTVLCTTGCALAVIFTDAFERLIKREKDLEIKKNVNFMR